MLGDAFASWYLAEYETGSRVYEVTLVSTDQIQWRPRRGNSQKELHILELESVYCTLSVSNPFALHDAPILGRSV